MAALEDGRVLVIGGTVDDSLLLDSTEVFDPLRGSFVPGPRLVHGRYKLVGSVTVLPDGTVVVAGGGPGIEVIDPKLSGSALVPGSESMWASFATLIPLPNGRVAVVGGYDRAIQLRRQTMEFELPAPVERPAGS
jgi:hypothetical protein